ncbi:SusD family protein [Saccharicrinis fermentans DSM 9555 = JCM 21142]|uniref:SusD family protein n=2 Tax=Saccharicrinis fermentans TaxID=982 RepID=W7Y0Z6_9BACT|nr:SusD family protein [Saccharicrinis fermentans DSM 9555 = JCM 21142]
MKIKLYILLFIFAPLFVSCEDYLDKQQDQDGMDQYDVFEELLTAKEFLNGAYADLITEVDALGSSADYLPGMTMSGEGHPGRLSDIGATDFLSVYPAFSAGEYLSLMDKGSNYPNFVGRYKRAWQSIRTTCSFLENCDLIADASSDEVDLLKGQAYFLRAFNYHLLTKRHGGLIYLKSTIDLNEPFNQTRESYESNYEDMIEDLDLAIALLPVTWESGEYGRPTKGAAMALKSRISLFRASPLVNESNDVTKWEAAAEAAGDLINYAADNGLYPLIDASAAITMDVDHNGADLYVPEHELLEPYRSIFVGPGKTKIVPDEVIFMVANNKLPVINGVLGFPSTALTNGFTFMKGNQKPMGIGATANFVEKFETKNGLAIEDDPSYNPQEPFINRDPRFYNNILFDGVPWIEETQYNKTGIIDLATVNENGASGLDRHNYALTSNADLYKVRNLTGLLIRKWRPHGWLWSSNRNFHVNENVFRMAEVYLNYAEAVNEAYGPNGTSSNCTLTALEAVNMIRNRVGMPNVNSIYTGDVASFRERIHNERAIELCFEGIRYDDIRRWKTAGDDENTKVEYLEQYWQGVSETYPTGYRYSTEEQPALKKTFSEKHYWWPIPTSEIEAVPSFGQTPGW